MELDHVFQQFFFIDKGNQILRTNLKPTGMVRFSIVLNKFIIICPIRVFHIQFRTQLTLNMCGSEMFQKWILIIKHGWA